MSAPEASPICTTFACRRWGVLDTIIQAREARYTFTPSTHIGPILVSFPCCRMYALHRVPPNQFPSRVSGNQSPGGSRKPRASSRREHTCGPPVIDSATSPIGGWETNHCNGGQAPKTGMIWGPVSLRQCISLELAGTSHTGSVEPRELPLSPSGTLTHTPGPRN